MTDMITVVEKKPGERPVIRQIENELHALQEAVGGYIEVMPCLQGEGLVICNEEGRTNGMPYNCTFENVDYFGPILICGVDGEEFADCPRGLHILIRSNGGNA